MLNKKEIKILKRRSPYNKYRIKQITNKEDYKFLDRGFRCIMYYEEKDKLITNIMGKLVNPQFIIAKPKRQLFRWVAYVIGILGVIMAYLKIK